MGLLNIFQTLIDEIYRGRDVFLTTVIGGEREEIIGSHTLFNSTGNIIEDSPLLNIKLPDISTVKTGVLTVDVEGEKVELMVEPLFPKPTLLVFGSGHIAQCLASMGKLLSYEVVVIDDRFEYANRNNFPSASQIFCGNFDEILDQIPFHSQCYAILATRGHQTDTTCLSYLINKNIPYIGMVGSVRKIRSIFELLKDRGIDTEQRSNIFAPVGLDIHAESPQEIAISILSEIQLVRFGGTGRPLSFIENIQKVHRYDNDRMRQELDLYITMAKALEEGKKFATILILKTKGHVPRGVGSRMIVWEDGTFNSTIGGGRRENEIIQQALQSIKNGTIYKDEVDFAGRHDSFQPVCGGRYQYFIQPFLPSGFKGSKE